jgi:hypothetical protein
MPVHYSCYGDNLATKNMYSIVVSNAGTFSVRKRIASIDYPEPTEESWVSALHDICPNAL